VQIAADSSAIGQRARIARLIQSVAREVFAGSLILESV
jgi:hypothetical protein